MLVWTSLILDKLKYEDQDVAGVEPRKVTVAVVRGVGPQILKNTPTRPGENHPWADSACPAVSGIR